MTYLVSARKWRPAVFEDVVGQQHIATTLRNAIATDRLSHAYIFSGGRGCGKTTTARILAKAINCLHPKDQNPDNECELCREITENRSVNVFEIDGASNRGVDEIRNLREAVRYGPAKGKYKVYIIDEVHMLTKEAFNALLKTLEEPPPYIIFIFATTEIHKVPLTILSRCQRFDFRRIAIEEIIGRLKFIALQEGITIDDDALLLVAKRADGSMRDAQSIFDQIVSFSGNKISANRITEMLNIVDEELYFTMTDLIKTHDVKGGLLLSQEVLDAGHDGREFLIGLVEHFRNILVARITGSTDLIETSGAYKNRYQKDAAAFSENDVLRLITIASNAESSLRWSQQPRLKFEVSVMQMVKMDSSVQIEQLLEDLESLKKKGNDNGSPAEQIAALTRDREPPVPVKTQKIQHAPVSFTPVGESSVLYPKAGNSPAMEVSPSQEAHLTRLSINEVMGKWSSFIDAARKDNIHVGTMLSETRPLSVQAERVSIGCPDDFHMDTLKRNRQFLTDLAHRVYGAKVILETMLAKESPSDPPREPPDAASATAPSVDGKLRQHPVVQALIKEFNAEIIP